MTDRDRLAQRIRRLRTRDRAEVQRCEREIGRLARQLAEFQFGPKRQAGGTRGRPKQLSTEVLGMLVRKFVAAGLKAKEEELRSLMTERQRQRSGRGPLTNRQRSALVHREAAKHYRISKRYLLKLLEG